MNKVPENWGCLRRIKNWLIYKLILVIISISEALSRNLALRWGGRLGLMIYWLFPGEGRKTKRNLKKAFTKMDGREVTKFSKQVFFNMGKNAVDAMRLRKTSSEQIKRLVKAQGFENLDSALARGRGVILLTGHIGNWELLGAYIASMGYPLNVVAAELYDPRLYEIILSSRRKFGVKNLTRGKQTRDIIRALRRGEIVAFLIDQDTKKVEGTFVNFFGKPAYTPVGPVQLALKLDVPIIPVASYMQEDGTYYALVEEELKLTPSGNWTKDIQTNIAKCSEQIEKFILKCPTQWVWMHERWKTKRDDLN